MYQNCKFNRKYSPVKDPTDEKKGKLWFNMIESDYRHGSWMEALQLIKWKHIFPVLSSNAHSKSVNPSLCIFVTKGKFCNWILLLLFCVLFPRYSFWLHSLHMHELEDRPLIPSALWVVIMHMWAVHTNTPSKYVKTQQQHFLHWIRTIPTISATKTIHTFSLLYNKRDCMDKTFYHNIQKPLIQPTHPYVWAARDKAMTFLVSKSHRIKRLLIFWIQHFIPTETDSIQCSQIGFLCVWCVT